MKTLDRKQILAALRLKTEVVEVAEWGGSVTVSEMSAADRDAWERSLVPQQAGDPANLDNIRARLAVMCIVDEAGEKLFKLTDAAELGKQSAVALDRVVAVAQRLNGLRNTDVEVAKGN